MDQEVGGREGREGRGLPPPPTRRSFPAITITSPNTRTQSPSPRVPGPRMHARTPSPRAQGRDMLEAVTESLEHTAKEAKANVEAKVDEEETEDEFHENVVSSGQG